MSVSRYSLPYLIEGGRVTDERSYHTADVAPARDFGTGDAQARGQAGLDRCQGRTVGKPANHKRPP
jgi:hypothetical protein